MLSSLGPRIIGPGAPKRALLVTKCLALIPAGSWVKGTSGVGEDSCQGVSLPREESASPLWALFPGLSDLRAKYHLQPNLCPLLIWALPKALWAMSTGTWACRCETERPQTQREVRTPAYLPGVPGQDHMWMEDSLECFCLRRSSKELSGVFCF